MAGNAQNTQNTQGQAASGLEVGPVEFKIHHSASRQFFWTLHDMRHGADPLAESRDFATRQLCLESIGKVQKLAPQASVLDTTT